MQSKTPESLADEAILYGKLLNTTRELIQLMTDADEDPGDLPLFYEKIQKRARKCVQEIEGLLDDV